MKNNSKNQISKKPFVLSPCGDMDSLLAAISAGADEVYFGTDLFNARMRAKNFDLDMAKDAIMLCHAHGTRVCVTLNIGIYDKEFDTMLSYVYSLYSSGVDALIVSDIGAMCVIHKLLPDLDIHASTQCTIHNIDGVDFFKNIGCTRAVIARELSKENIEYICKKSDIETESFVHGAHCMSVSGQCLMSFAMGGRSGNRGLCAQPCRLPYEMNGKTSYPLSLKDMSLSSHITDFVNMGVTSLKIEGRLKSPEYVYGVTSIFRKLIDENRNATNDEMKYLSSLFSRQGFTDGYYMNHINDSMLGTRTEENKDLTKNISVTIPDIKKVPLSVHGIFRKGLPSQLILKDKYGEISVCGDIVQEAKSVPMSEEDIIKNLSKLGNTPYYLDEITIEKDENVNTKVSSINKIRRDGVEKLLNKNRLHLTYEGFTPEQFKGFKIKNVKTAVFSDPLSIPDNSSFFDYIFVPVDKYKKVCQANGVSLPPVILDNEWDEVDSLLQRVIDDGISNVLVTNVSQIEHLKNKNLTLFGDFRLNIFNTSCANYLIDSGLSLAVLSPELSLPQCKVMMGSSVIVYGKFPIMTTHKCILKNTYGCDRCKGYLKDRTGAKMYCEGIYGHRNVIYNSVPVYMADKLDLLNGFSYHFIFTDESKKECEKIVDAYINKDESKSSNIRRIK